MRCFLLSLVIHIQVVTLLALQSGYRSISSQIIAYRSNKGTDGCSSLSSSRASPLQLFRQDSTADTLTIEEIEKFATFSKLKIKSSVTGPYLRLEAYPIDDETSLVGYLTAFIRPFPFKLFQLDTIQVKNRRQNIGYKRKNWTVDGPGASFILGTWALAWARQQGCQQTELLAVRDSDEMHDILVRLYGR